MRETVCPRCAALGAAKDYEGMENGDVIWTIHRCPTCCFSWRDTESIGAIGVGIRSADFAVDARNLDRYPRILEQ